LEEKKSQGESDKQKLPKFRPYHLFLKEVREVTSLYPSGILLGVGNTEEWKQTTLQEGNPQASELIFMNLFTTIF